MSAHTPGPWRLDAKHSDHFGGHSPELMVDGYHFIDAGDGYSPKGFSVASHMSLADAVLITHAPDLLAALEWALPFAEKYDTNFPGGPRANLMDAKLVELRALIAKARGAA